MQTRIVPKSPHPIAAHPGTPPTRRAGHRASHAFIGVFIFLLLLAHAADHWPGGWIDTQSLRDQWSLDGRKALLTRWWTPLTYALVHFDAWHLAWNLGAITLFGYGLGKEWSWQRIATLTWVTALGGAALWWTIHHGQRGTVIGASAIASGYVTAFVIARPRDGIPILGTRWSFPRWVLLVVLLGMEGRGLWLEAKGQLLPQAVSHSAHVGGAIAAAVLCLTMGLWKNASKDVKLSELKNSVSGE